MSGSARHAGERGARRGCWPLLQPKGASAPASAPAPRTEAKVSPSCSTVQPPTWPAGAARRGSGRVSAARSGDALPTPATLVPTRPAAAPVPGKLVRWEQHKRNSKQRPLPTRAGGPGAPGAGDGQVQLPDPAPRADHCGSRGQAAGTLVASLDTPCKGPSAAAPAGVQQQVNSGAHRAQSRPRRLRAAGQRRGAGRSELCRGRHARCGAAQRREAPPAAPSCLPPLARSHSSTARHQHSNNT